MVVNAPETKLGRRIGNDRTSIAVFNTAYTRR